MPYRIGIRWGYYLTTTSRCESPKTSSNFYIPEGGGVRPIRELSLTKNKGGIMKNIEIIMDLDFTLDYTDYLYGESLSA